MRRALKDPSQTDAQAQLLQGLATWDGSYSPDSIYPTVFTQWLYEIARAAMLDELGPLHFENLLKTRALDHALPQLLLLYTSYAAQEQRSGNQGGCLSRKIKQL